jgi:hypothetical protein
MKHPPELLYYPHNQLLAPAAGSEERVFYSDLLGMDIA